MQELLEEVRGAPHLLPLLPVLSQRRGQGQGEDEDSQQGILLSVSYGYAVDTMATEGRVPTLFHVQGYSERIH